MVEPTTQGNRGEDGLCLRPAGASGPAGQFSEDGLTHLGRQRRVTPTAAQGGGIHKIHLAADQFLEGRLRARCGALAQPFRAVDGGIHFNS